MKLAPVRRSAWSLVPTLLACGIPAIAAPPPPSAPPTVEDLDRLYAKRDQPNMLPVMEKRTREAWLAQPANFDVLWRAARERTFVADQAQDQRLRKQAGKEAWNLGEMAIRLKPERVEGYYYAATGIGIYADAVGALTALSHDLISRFVEYMERAAKMDPKFDRGGPLVCLGKYYEVIPWPKRDLVKAEQLYQQALNDFPENLRARLFLARVKAKRNQEDEAEMLIAQVKNGAIDYDPAEGRHVKLMLASGLQR